MFKGILFFHSFTEPIKGYSFVEWKICAGSSALVLLFFLPQIPVRNMVFRRAGFKEIQSTDVRDHDLGSANHETTRNEGLREAV